MEVYVVLQKDTEVSLFQGDNLPLVFEDKDDAYEAMADMGEPAFVVAVEPDIVVERLRDGGYSHLAFDPSDDTPTVAMKLEDFSEYFRRLERKVEEMQLQATQGLLDELVEAGKAEYDPETKQYRVF